MQTQIIARRLRPAIGRTLLANDRLGPDVSVTAILMVVSVAWKPPLPRHVRARRGIAESGHTKPFWLETGPRARLRSVRSRLHARFLENHYRLAALGDVGATVFQRLLLLGDRRTPKAKLFGIAGHAKYSVFGALVSVGIAAGIAFNKAGTTIWTNHSAVHEGSRPQ